MLLQEDVCLLRTLQQSDSPKATVVSEKWQETQTILASSLTEAKLVGTVEVAVVPVPLGGGIPLFSLSSEAD